MPNEITAAAKAITRENVNRLERQMLAMPQVQIPVEHLFSHNVAVRKISIPKGTALTGRIHKYANLNVLLEGEMSVSTESGLQRVKAPFMVVSPPGTKRVAYAHEDCVWATILGTGKTDVDEIESEFTAADEQEYLSFCRQQLKGD